MKRKPAKPKTAKKKPGLTAKSLGDHFKEEPIIPSVDDGAIRVTSDGEWVWESKPTTEIDGVPLPPDLELAVGYYAGHVFRDCRNTLCFPPLEDVTDEESPKAPDGMPRARRLRPSPPPGWKEADLTPDGWRTIGEAIKNAFRAGFYLALLRYADELKHVPEAAAMLEANRKNAKKGGDARRKDADSRRKEARRLDREMRNTVKKKYLRVQRIAAQMKVGERTIERYLAPKK